MDQLTIGNLAKQTKVGIVTLRHYEKCGLLKPSKRSRGGYRIYSPEAIDQLVFIKNAKNVGFTLKEIKSLFKLLQNKKTTCREIKTYALEKIDYIKEKITNLQNMQNMLKKWTTICDGKSSIDKCPILKNLKKAKI